MSEWLTTGQLIEKLNIGEEAVCSLGCMHIKKNENGEIVHLDHPQGTAILNKGILTAKWRILPKYITFEEAMQALKNGKKVTLNYHNSTIYNIGTGTEFDSLSPLELKDFIFGKWQIIE